MVKLAIRVAREGFAEVTSDQTEKINHDDEERGGSSTEALSPSTFISVKSHNFFFPSGNCHTAHQSVSGPDFENLIKLP